MKLRDILEYSSPTEDMLPDDQTSSKVGLDQAPTDDKGWKRTIRHGANSKKAVRIASMARTAAKDADPVDGDPSQPGQAVNSLKLN
jgi:hypothetical protein